MPKDGYDLVTQLLEGAAHLSERRDVRERTVPSKVVVPLRLNVPKVAP
ncbi:hypothetical protein [Devosia nitrariae]|nr:hypothetical protein [Devosia nitrariae]